MSLILKVAREQTAGLAMLLFKKMQMTSYLYQKTKVSVTLMIMISRLFKTVFSITVLCFMNQLSAATEYKFATEYRAMDESWPLLPNVPDSFQSASDLNVDLEIDFGRFGFEIGQANLDLELIRSVEPIDVSLSGKKDTLSLFYKLSDYQKITLHGSRQGADQQRFECYDFIGITIGSCEASDIQISSSKVKYDNLDGDLVAIAAETKTVGLSFFQATDLKWLDSFSVGIFSTTHEYDWLTPVEDLRSPFILGLVINGKTLGDAITETFKKFPQRDMWRLNQLNFSGRKAISIYGPVEVFVDADFAYLHHSNYRAVESAPNYNVKIRAGLRYESRPLLVELYGNYYHHNFIGFEPITFNQRTEHRFDDPYGNVGARVQFRF